MFSWLWAAGMFDKVPSDGFNQIVIFRYIPWRNTTLKLIPHTENESGITKTATTLSAKLYHQQDDGHVKVPSQQAWCTTAWCHKLTAQRCNQIFCSVWSSLLLFSAPCPCCRHDCTFRLISLIFFLSSIHFICKGQACNIWYDSFF